MGDAENACYLSDAEIQVGIDITLSDSLAGKAFRGLKRLRDRAAAAKRAELREELAREIDRVWNDWSDANDDDPRSMPHMLADFILADRARVRLKAIVAIEHWQDDSTDYGRGRMDAARIVRALADRTPSSNREPV